MIGPALGRGLRTDGRGNAAARCYDGGVAAIYSPSPGNLYVRTSTFCMLGSALNSSAP